MRIFVAAVLFGALSSGAYALTYEEKLPACLSCHGEQGISENPEVPSLAGMPADFTLIQLFLFRQGTRKFSEYFAKLPPPKGPREAADPQVAARAKTAIAANHCSSCHNPDFSGRDQ